MPNLNIIFDNDVLYGRGERQAVAWVGARMEWQRVQVTRGSEKPFDLYVAGTMLGPITGRTNVDFQGCFLNSALYTFWKENFIVAPQNEWSRVLQRDDEINWRVFENVYVEQARKKASVPMFSHEFISAVYATWQEIYPDAGRCSNAEAIELCLDADRLSTQVGEWADKEFDAAQEEHGYEKAWRELARVVKLV